MIGAVGAWVSLALLDAAAAAHPDEIDASIRGITGRPWLVAVPALLGILCAVAALRGTRRSARLWLIAGGLPPLVALAAVLWALVRVLAPLYTYRPI